LPDPPFRDHVPFYDAANGGKLLLLAPALHAALARPPQTLAQPAEDAAPTRSSTPAACSRCQHCTIQVRPCMLPPLVRTGLPRDCLTWGWHAPSSSD
jgi:hypothetical protein